MRRLALAAVLVLAVVMVLGVGAGCNSFPGVQNAAVVPVGQTLTFSGTNVGFVAGIALDSVDVPGLPSWLPTDMLKGPWYIVEGLNMSTNTIPVTDPAASNLVLRAKTAKR